jgi:hypothetical protein
VGVYRRAGKRLVDTASQDNAVVAAARAAAAVIVMALIYQFMGKRTY